MPTMNPAPRPLTTDVSGSVWAMKPAPIVAIVTMGTTMLSSRVSRRL
jgi:hypothetical protein